jgi:hypothetical protein
MATGTIAVHPEVLQFPQSVPAKEPITQLELELFLSLRSRLAQLETQIATAEAGLRTRFETGATVEPGAHHVELKEHSRRNVAWKSIVIRLAERLKMDGELYCARVLASTKPNKTVSLEIR